jgi:hypothetical protein
MDFRLSWKGWGRGIKSVQQLVKDIHDLLSRRYISRSGVDQGGCNRGGVASIHQGIGETDCVKGYNMHPFFINQPGGNDMKHEAKYPNMYDDVVINNERFDLIDLVAPVSPLMVLPAFAFNLMTLHGINIPLLKLKKLTEGDKPIISNVTTLRRALLTLSDVYHNNITPIEAGYKMYEVDPCNIGWWVIALYLDTSNEVLKQALEDVKPEMPELTKKVFDRVAEKQIVLNKDAVIKCYKFVEI